MKKITVLKNEGVAEVIDRVLAEQDDDVTVVVPKESALGRSVRNFHLLKREAEDAGKTVAIESVDETILAFAKESGMEGTHPLWRGVTGGGGLADIIPTEGMPLGSDESSAAKKRGKSVKKKAPPAPVKLTVREETEEKEEIDEPEKEEVKEEAQTFVEEEGRFFRRRSAPEIAAETKKEADAEDGESDEDDEDEYEGESRRRMPRKLLWGAIGVVVVVLAVLGIMTWSFGRVTITIDFQKTPWAYAGNFTADKSVSKINAANNIVPAQVFTSQKNTTQLFPASGNANVSIRAQGTLTIYNAYSSAAQDLVATTRFVTPDGKLFRLASSVTVPGAKVTNGQIVPSSIDTTVVADQAGPSYNVGAVDKLTIPGFQGSAKYTAFYGQLKSGTTGGFTGAKAVPTAADIASAKTKVTATLTSSLTSDLTTSYPNNFKILDGATNIQMTKLTVSTTTDASGNFSVFGNAALRAIGFDESAFKAFLLSQADEQTPNSTFSALTLSYGAVKADFTKGTVGFSLAASGTLEAAFDADAFKTNIAGKSIGDARTAVAAIPGLADGKISAWPMWLWSIPGNPAKVQINAN